MSEVGRFPQFPISFSIQLIRSDKNRSILLTGRQYDHICRYSLIGLDLDNMANFEIFTKDLFGSSPLEQSIGLIIGLKISFFAIVIIIGFFKESEAKYQCKGCDVCEEKTNFEHIDELAECDDEEEEIEEVSELVVKHQRQE